MSGANEARAGIAVGARASASAVGRPRAGGAEGSISVVAVDGSPTGGGRTSAGLGAVTAASAGAGASIETVTIRELSDAELEALAERLVAADAVVFASPVYRAGFATPLKRLLDAIPRSQSREAPDSPLSGKAAAIVYTGASLHHFLALDGLRNVLAGFFAAHVLPPGLYLPRDAFAGEPLELVEPYASQARLQGQALVELALALRRSPLLASLRPQA